MISSDAKRVDQLAIFHVFVPSPRSHLIPAKFWKHCNVVRLGFFSSVTKNSERRSPNKTPQMSANIIEAESMDRALFSLMMYSIFFLTWAGNTADFSTKDLPS